jgi:hypothetical protein
MFHGSAAEQSGSNVEQLIAKLRQAPDPVVTRSSGSHGRIASDCKQFGTFQNSKSEMAHAAGVAHGKACSTLPKRPN